MGYHRKFIEGMEYLVNTCLGACLSLSKGIQDTSDYIFSYIYFRNIICHCPLRAVRQRFLPNPACQTLMLSTEIVITYLRTATSMVTKIPDNEQTFVEKERQFVRRDSFSA